MRRHSCDVLAVDQPWSHPSAGSGGGLLAQLANHAVGQKLPMATGSSLASPLVPKGEATRYMHHRLHRVVEQSKVAKVSGCLRSE